MRILLILIFILVAVPSAIVAARGWARTRPWARAILGIMFAVGLLATLAFLVVISRLFLD